MAVQKGSFLPIVGILVIVFITGGFLYFKTSKNYVFTPSITANPSSYPTNQNSEIKENGNHSSKYISFSYPTSLHIWSDGLGPSLEYFQINSESEPVDMNFVSIIFDIQTLNFQPDGTTLEEHQKYLEDNKINYPSFNYIIGNGLIDGNKSLASETTIDYTSENNFQYNKMYWLTKNGVKYKISFRVLANTPQKREQLKTQYMKNFETILDSIKLK